MRESIDVLPIARYTYLITTTGGYNVRDFQSPRWPSALDCALAMDSKYHLMACTKRRLRAQGRRLVEQMNDGQEFRDLDRAIERFSARYAKFNRQSRETVEYTEALITRAGRVIRQQSVKETNK